MFNSTELIVIGSIHEQRRMPSLANSVNVFFYFIFLPLELQK